MATSVVHPGVPQEFTEQEYCERIGRLITSGEIANIPHWGDGSFVVRDGNGKWLIEGFIGAFRSLHEAMRAINPSIPPMLPPHILDPEVIAWLFGIPLEDTNWQGNAKPEVAKAKVVKMEQQSQATEEFADLPKEVSTAEAARLLGISKDTVLKLKETGLLEYRNMAPPSSSRPVYAFSLQSVLKLRTTYETDEPVPFREKEPGRRATRGVRKYKHLKVEY